jgi:hypothetical protein
MCRSTHSRLTAMLREAHVSSHEAALTGAPIDEVTGLRAERRRVHAGRVGEAIEAYNESVTRAVERGAPDDERAKRRAMASLMAAANGELSRRRFLAGAGAVGAGFALAGSTVLRATPARAASQPRIVIVGGGAAGLRCAHKLWTHSGWTCTVYEANTSVGGRIETNRGYFANGQLVEMHGEFISSEHAATLALVSSFGLTLDDTNATPNGTSDTYRFNGARYTQAQLNADWQSFGYQAFHSAVKTVPWPQTYSHHNSTGVSWDNMSVPQWMTAHLSGGTTSDFGKLMLADVTAEYGATRPTSRRSTSRCCSATTTARAARATSPRPARYWPGPMSVGTLLAATISSPPRWSASCRRARSRPARCCSPRRRTATARSPAPSTAAVAITR